MILLIVHSSASILALPMCGRFTIRTSPASIAKQFSLFDAPGVQPRFNVAPTQDVLVVRDNDGRREAALLRWGLVPSWAPDLSIGARMINARGETVHEKRSFKTPLALRRCLVVADGFYEWQRTERVKQPYYFRMKDDRPFGLAGLWERRERDGQIVESCTIITTHANEVLAPVHDRMPAIVDEKDYERWLDCAACSADQARELIAPFPAEQMTGTTVSTWVNSPTHEGERCLEPV